MRSFWANLISLVVPAGAPPGTPSIAIGSSIPADLQAFYTALGTPVVTAIIYRASATIYAYTAVLSGSSTLAQGSSNAGVVAELSLAGSVAGVANLGFGLESAASVAVGSSGPGAIAGSSFSLGETAAFNIDNVSQGRGLKGRVDSTANSAAVGAETVVLTTPNISFVAGRAYAIKWRGQINHSAANVGTVRVRKTNIAGATLVTANYSAAGAQNETQTDVAYVICNAGSTAPLVLTLQASAGTLSMTGTANNIRYLEVFDVGSSSDFPNAPAV